VQLRLAYGDALELLLDPGEHLAGGAVLRAAGRAFCEGGGRSRAESRRLQCVATTGAQGGGRGGRGPALEVLVDPAGQHRDLPVAEERPDGVGHPLEEVAVVRDHDERARPAVEEVLEDVEGLDVEVVGRLVEEQHVGLGQQQPQQLEAAPLATGQVAEPRGQPVAGEAEPLQQRGRGDLRRRRLRDPPDRLDRRQHPRLGSSSSSAWVRCCSATVRPCCTRPRRARARRQQAEHRASCRRR
jgi:hypothetical protein